MQQKPIFIIVPGAFHVGRHWKDVVDRLGQQGFEAFAIDKPSTGKRSGGIRLADDIAVVRKAIEDVCARGNDVVLVAHSYGGLPASGSFEGLVKGQQSDRAGVIGMISVASVLVSTGAPLNDTGKPRHAWYTLKDGLLHPHLNGEQPAAEDGLFNDCSPEIIGDTVKKLLPQSWQSFLDPSPFAGWREVPLTYVICMQDRAYPTATQEEWVQRNSEALGERLTVKRLDCAHSPFVNKQEELVEIFVDAANRYLE